MLRIILLIFLLSPSAFAAKKLQPLDAVKAIFKRYWQADSIFMSVNKKSIIGLLEKETNYEGRLLFSKGQLRIDLVKPEASSVVFNKHNIIAIKKIKKDKKIQTYVTIIDKKRAKNENALIGLLFGDEKVWSELKLVKKKQIKDRVSLHFVPKDKKKLPSIVRVAIVIDVILNEIVAIKQWDDRENIVQFDFSSLLFDIGYPKDTFNPVWPKSASVTRL